MANPLSKPLKAQYRIRYQYNHRVLVALNLADEAK